MPGPVIPMTKCCNIVSDLLTGVLPGVVDEAATDEFATFALIHDPAVGRFFDWTFVGGFAFNGCTFTPNEFTQWFGDLNSEGCFAGSQAVGENWQTWVTANAPDGTPSFDRDQSGEGLSTYYWVYSYDQAVVTPPDFQIVDATATPQPLTWVTHSPECITISFTVDDVDNAYIQAVMYGHNDIDTYFFGSFLTTPISDPGWSAYFLSLIPKGTGCTIVTNISGNDVTVTFNKAFRFLRGIRWQNDGTAGTGTALFTPC